MPKVTEVLRDAQALALFSNLEPQDIEFFRNNYPDFVPLAWWDYASTSLDSEGKHVPGPRKQWQLNQRMLREAWEKRFTSSLYYLVGLTMTVFEPEDLAAVAWGLSGGHRPAIADLSEVGFGYCPHQRAVLYLFEHPWRARFCAQCNKRFVAAQPKNKYCSEVCSHENRNRQKREWFAEHGSAQRAARKTKRKGIAVTVKKRAKRT